MIHIAPLACLYHLPTATSEAVARPRSEAVVGGRSRHFLMSPSSPLFVKVPQDSRRRNDFGRHKSCPDKVAATNDAGYAASHRMLRQTNPSSPGLHGSRVKTRKASTAVVRTRVIQTRRRFGALRPVGSSRAARGTRGRRRRRSLTPPPPPSPPPPWENFKLCQSSSLPEAADSPERRTAVRTAVPGTWRRETFLIRVRNWSSCIVSWWTSLSVRLPLSFSEREYICNRSGKIVGCLPALVPVDDAKLSVKID
jgi:hypothetical protein